LLGEQILKCIMDKPCYVLCPGFVTSRFDGDRHWISASRLAQLYNIDYKTAHVYTYSSKDLGWAWPEDAIFLHPQSDGNYTLPTTNQTPPS
jgi:hypothetical protein